MTDITKKIAELEELMAKATPGPWYETVTGEGIPSANAAKKEDYHGFSVAVQGMIQNSANIPLIVKTHNYLPELITEIERRKEFSALALAREEDARTNAYNTGKERDAAYARLDALEGRHETACQELGKALARAEKAEKQLELAGYEISELEDNLADANEEQPYCVKALSDLGRTLGVMDMAECNGDDLAGLVIEAVSEWKARAERAEAELASTRLVWTTELPQSPGFYFQRNAKGTIRGIFLCQADISEYHEPALRFDAYDKAIWTESAGPLQLPVEAAVRVAGEVE